MEITIEMKEQGWEANQGVYSYEHCNGETSEICENLDRYDVELPIEDAPEIVARTLISAVRTVEAHEAWIRSVA